MDAMHPIVYMRRAPSWLLRIIQDRFRSDHLIEVTSKQAKSFCLSIAPDHDIVVVSDADSGTSNVIAHRSICVQKLGEAMAKIESLKPKVVCIMSSIDQNNEESMCMVVYASDPKTVATLAPPLPEEADEQEDVGASSDEESAKVAPYVAPAEAQPAASERSEEPKMSTEASEDASPTGASEAPLIEPSVEDLPHDESGVGQEEEEEASVSAPDSHVSLTTRFIISPSEETIVADGVLSAAGMRTLASVGVMWPRADGQTRVHFSYHDGMVVLNKKFLVQVESFQWSMTLGAAYTASELPATALKKKLRPAQMERNMAARRR